MTDYNKVISRCGGLYESEANYDMFHGRGMGPFLQPGKCGGRVMVGRLKRTRGKHWHMTIPVHHG